MGKIKFPKFATASIGLPEPELKAMTEEQFRNWFSIEIVSLYIDMKSHRSRLRKSTKLEKGGGNN